MTRASDGNMAGLPNCSIIAISGGESLSPKVLAPPSSSSKCPHAVVTSLCLVLAISHCCRSWVRVASGYSMASRRGVNTEVGDAQRRLGYSPTDSLSLSRAIAFPTEEEGNRICTKLLCEKCCCRQRLKDRPNASGDSSKSRIGAPLSKRCVVNGQTTEASNKRVPSHTHIQIPHTAT